MKKEIHLLPNIITDRAITVSCVSSMLNIRLLTDFELFNMVQESQSIRKSQSITVVTVTIVFINFDCGVPI